MHTDDGLPDAAALYRRGMDMLPAWNDEGPDTDARWEAALAVIGEAAAAGSMEAVDYLAADAATDAERLRWSRVLAETGVFGPLCGHLTDRDGAGISREVLAAARAGEPWAMTALGYAYGMGMRNRDGVELATTEGAFGWMPAAADPAAEARDWTERAAAAGFGPAHVRMVDRFGVEGEAAVAHLRAGLAWAALHPVIRERAAELLAELTGETAVVPSDPVEARRHHAVAAAAGDVASMRELGRMYEEGLGGPVDLDAAREQYEQAAELGADEFARHRLVQRWGLDWYAVGPDEQG